MSTLPMIFKKPIEPVPECDWNRLKSEADGICYAIEKSGLQDKSIALETGIDPATLSKAKSGQARLSERDADALMDVTGSEAPLFARLLRRSYDPRSLRKLKTETERERDEALAEIARMNAEREVWLRLMKELRS